MLTFVLLTAFTLADEMKLRSIVDVKISPDGERVAYVVSTPNLDTNQHDAALYVATWSRLSVGSAPAESRRHVYCAAKRWSGSRDAKRRADSPVGSAPAKSGRHVYCAPMLKESNIAAIAGFSRCSAEWPTYST